MEIPKHYDANQSEEKWYRHWTEKGYFHSVPDDREPYTVVIPPPNVTGVLHMGHMLNNTIQDILVRRARMQGKNACWVPGTDHASIATEAKVVAQLRSEGVQKSDLSRAEFLRYAMEWKEKYGGVILEQLKKLGASCDWQRTNFTLRPDYSENVTDTFIDLYRKGKIYRDFRMVNWDPTAQTALSDEEVIHKEVNSMLYAVRYKIAGTEDEWLTVATTRPETILGDTAVCVHPNDARYVHLKGKRVIVPIVQREVPIIQDEYVDMEFGTGCLKVTPAHDENDYRLGKKHHLDTIDLFNDDGSLNANGMHYEGKDRFVVRQEIAKELKSSGDLVDTTDYINKVGYSERTQTPIESRLSLQWFLSMQELARPALDAVMNGDVQFHPDNMKNTYRHWMENIKDWCISRQLWWGHQLPVWYYGDEKNDFVVAKTAEEAVALASKKEGRPIALEEVKQDEDVLDTWFSSWLWPIALFKGLHAPDNAEFNYYYPTNDLVTAPEIMFFWVARMIVAGIEYTGKSPFKNVYYTGIVRDKLGRKMSKSLGNSPDPVDLIEQYGADGVRLGVLIASPAGNDLLFERSQCEQGRNFSNKVWNALRLVSLWEKQPIEQAASSKVVIEWFDSTLNQAVQRIDEHFGAFRISDALMTTYRLVWDSFCSWYLELIKPAYQQPIDLTTFDQTIVFFEKIVRLMHPFMPFVTEEIWHWLGERKEGEDLIVAPWPKSAPIHLPLLKEFEIASAVVTQIRSIRAQNNIPQKVPLSLFVHLNGEQSKQLDSVLLKMGNLSAINYVDHKVKQAFSFIEQNNEYFIPYEGDLNLKAEKRKMELELEYTMGSLAIVQKKLSNERFVANAPENVVAAEHKKEASILHKIKLLEEKLTELKAALPEG